jgi:hypothetical protein
MQCNVEFGHQLSIRSGIKENHGTKESTFLGSSSLVSSRGYRSERAENAIVLLLFAEPFLAKDLHPAIYFLLPILSFFFLFAFFDLSTASLFFSLSLLYLFIYFTPSRSL